MNENKHSTVAPTESEILIVDVIPKIEYNVVPKAEAVLGVIDDEIVPEQFIPTSSLYLEDYIRPQELLVCRACLLSDCRLYSMRSHNLEEIYRRLTNAPLSVHNDNIPLLLCAKCACFLEKCQQFSQKTNIAQEMLNSLAFPVTYKQIKKSYDKVNKEFSSLTVQHIPPDNYDYRFSECCIEVNIKSEIKDEIKSDDEGPIKDQPSSNLNNDETDDDVPLSKMNKNLKTQEKDTEPAQKQDVVKSKSNVRKPSKQSVVKRIGRHNLVNKFTKQCFTLEEQIAAVQKRKESHSYKFFKYKCDVCYLAFNQETEYSEHMAKHDKGFSNHLCNVCHLRFKDHASVLHHKRAHKWLYSCVHCSYTTHMREHAVRHAPRHEEMNQSGDGSRPDGSNSVQVWRRKRPPCINVRVVCEVCGKSMTVGHLKGHMDEHAGKTFKCEPCGREFNNSFKYKKHVVDYHTGIKTVCPYCDKKYSTKWVMRKHVAAMHTGDVRRFPCEQCGRAFKFRYVLRAHVETVHLNFKTYRKPKPKEKPVVVKERPEPDPAKPFVCEHCYKGFKNRAYLQQHLNFVHYKKPRNRYWKTKSDTKDTGSENGTKDRKKPGPVRKAKQNARSPIL